MRSPTPRFGLIGCLAVLGAIAAAGILGVASTAQAQVGFRNFSVGPRAPMMSPSFRSEPRFRRFNNNAPDDIVVENGKGKGKGKGKGRGSNTKVSNGDPNGKDGRPSRPTRGKNPPFVPIVGTGVATGTPGPAGAGTPPAGTVAQRGGVVIPPPNENRFVKNEVLGEVAGNIPQQPQLTARHRLQRIESTYFPLTNTTVYRWRIPDGRSVRAVLAEFRREGGLLLVQPNFLFRGSQSGAADTAPRESELPKPVPAVAAVAAIPAGDPAQYVLGKLHINEAHQLATGDKVLVAVIDSGIDLSHPELKGAIAGSFDALGKVEKPHMHGTAIAGAIVAHARLMGAAPAAKILAIRAFGVSGDGAEATTAAIRKGIEYAAAQHARVINMSFAGPDDPGLARHIAAAKGQGIVLIAASGNFGPKSPPQYPAADPNVIAVSATDADDHLFRAANIGPHIAVTAPGVDILLPVPDNDYQLISGTSFAAAYVSGVAALMIQRAPGLTPDAVRHILESTAKDIGQRGKDPEFGAGLVDAYAAITAVEANAAVTEPQAAAEPKEISQQVKPQ